MGVDLVKSEGNCGYYWWVRGLDKYTCNLVAGHKGDHMELNADGRCVARYHATQIVDTTGPVEVYICGETTTYRDGSDLSIRRCTLPFRHSGYHRSVSGTSIFSWIQECEDGLSMDSVNAYHRADCSSAYDAAYTAHFSAYDVAYTAHQQYALPPFRDGSEIEKDVGVAMNYDLDQLLRLCQQHHLADDKTLRLFACYCARSVLDHISDQKTRDICQRTIEVAQRFAHGLATKEELGAARSADCFAADYAAYCTAYNDACFAVFNASCYAARSVAHSVARSADYSAHDYASDYPHYYASNYSAAYTAAKQQYAHHLLEMVPSLKKILARHTTSDTPIVGAHSPSKIETCGTTTTNHTDVVGWWNVQVCGASSWVWIFFAAICFPICAFFLSTLLVGIPILTVLIPVLICGASKSTVRVGINQPIVKDDHNQQATQEVEAELSPERWLQQARIACQEQGLDFDDLAQELELEQSKPRARTRVVDSPRQGEDLVYDQPIDSYVHAGVEVCQTINTEPSKTRSRCSC
jgi:hypothetical protein